MRSDHLQPALQRGFGQSLITQLTHFPLKCFPISSMMVSGSFSTSFQASSKTFRTDSCLQVTLTGNGLGLTMK